MSTKLSITAIFIAVCLIIQSQSEPCEAREIVSEDVLMITVYGQPDLSISIRVSSEGEISFPLLGTLNVAGKTVRELEKEIEELLDKDYIVNPHVAVFTTEYHLNIVYVMGEVNAPQAIDLTKNKVTTILEVISMAGGFTGLANKNKILIIRTAPDGTKENITVKLASIIKKRKKGKVDGEDETAIRPGDVIMITGRKF